MILLAQCQVSHIQHNISIRPGTGQRGDGGEEEDQAEDCPVLVTLDAERILQIKEVTSLLETE